MPDQSMDSSCLKMRIGCLALTFAAGPKNANSDRIVLVNSYFFRKLRHDCLSPKTGSLGRKAVSAHLPGGVLFKIDVGTCERCGTDMEIRAAVQDPDGIARYLRHISLDAHPPPIAPARSAVAFVAEVSAGPALAAGSAAWEYELEGHDKSDTH